MPTARRLKVDYSTVSRRIGELEKDLAVTLFERKPDGFILTGDGHRLFEIAEKMETLSFSVGDAFSNQPGEVHGRVRFATMEGIAAYYLSEKLGELNKIHPNLVVELERGLEDCRSHLCHRSRRFEGTPQQIVKDNAVMRTIFG